MFSRSLRRPPKTQLSPETLARAEQSLMAETLLRATARLLAHPDPDAAVEYMCASIVEATPHIALVWAWFGGPDVDVIEPQIVVGPASGYADSLRIKRNFLTELGPAYRVLRGRTTQAFEISTVSLFAPWRDLARRYDIRSVLVVPITNGGDERGLLALYSTRPRYFDAMGVGLFDVLGQLFHAVLTQSRKRAELETDSQQDVVTGLHSRRHAQRLIDDLWRTESDHENRGVLLLIDLDEFKQINDNYGHRMGDLALRHVARLLLKNLRRTDIVSRWGGDEFLAWLPALSGTVAMKMAEQLRESVAASVPQEMLGLPTILRISVGATPVPVGDSFVAALDRADRALRRAKQNGRNCVVVARPGA
jgi:diguanylate cyclase (GGDEF)-like protein